MNLEKLQLIVKKLEPILKAEDEGLKSTLSENYEPDELDILIPAVEKYEKGIARLLRNEKKKLKDRFNQFIGKDIDLTALLAFLLSQMDDDDEFTTELEALSLAILNEVTTKLVEFHMEIIDKDVAFNKLSKRTLDWIEKWSADLAELMNLGNKNGVERVLKHGLEEGWGIDKIALELTELPEFNRVRARMTALTEILTANSASQFEAYMQSPAVTGKKWKHSGARKIKPRPAHVAYSGTVVDVDKPFKINGYECMFPRDPVLPAKERVNCHCTMGPVVDRNILALSSDEKQKLHNDRVKKLNE